MCDRCDYPSLLENADLDHTPNRAAVLKTVGDSPHPLTAREILETIHRTHEVNRVTVYRILDLMVENGLLERFSSGDRSFRYGLAPNANHQPHPHFYCTICGRMECLDPQSLESGLKSLQRNFKGRIEKIEIRLDGACRECLKRCG